MTERKSAKQFAAELAAVQRDTISQTAFQETGIAWLGNEEGVVIIPPNERRHPAEAFWAYSDINGTRQVIRLANYDAALTYSNKDVRRAVRIGIPPGEELLGVLGIATQDAKVFGPASPTQVQAKKQAYLTPDRWQMYRLSPAGDRRVTVEAGWYYDNGVLRSTPAGELIDLDSLYPTNPSETRIVLLGWTAGATPRVLIGDVFTRVAGDPITNHFPTDAFIEGDVPLGGAILTYGETELVQARILPYLPFFEAIRTNIVNGVDVTAIQGVLFHNEGVSYQIHWVGDQIAAPTVNDDETSTPHPFGVGSIWMMSVTAGAAEDAVYMCVDPTDGAAVWLRLDGAGGGGGSMDDFTVAGDTGTPQTIADANTLTIAGGTGIATVAGATDTVTVNLEDTAVTPASYTAPNLTIDQQGRITAASNNTLYTDEQAQDAVGTILTDSSTIDFTYNDGTPSITGAVIADSIANTHLANMAALTVKARIVNSVGDPSDLAFTADGQFLVRRSGALTVDTLAAGDIPNLAASKITSGTLALARGGTNADLSATGGANQFVKQSSAGAAFTVGTIASADIATALTTPGTIGGGTPGVATFTNLNVNNRISITGAATALSYALLLTATTTNQTGVNISPVVTTNVDADLVDMLGSVTPTANLAAVYGVRFTATIAGSSSNNVTFLAGMSGQVGLGASYAGTITYAIGGYFGDVFKPGTGTITNQYGLYIVDQTKGTNKYGLQIDQSTGYAIYCGGAGAVYFAGAVTANSTLNVTGKVSTSADLQIGSGYGYYIGDSATNGSWRFTPSGANLVIQKREAGSWVTKSTITA